MSTSVVVQVSREQLLTKTCRKLSAASFIILQPAVSTFASSKISLYTSQGNTLLFQIECFHVFLSRLVETGSGNVQSLSLSDSHLAELDGDTLRLFGLGALEALERGWGVQTAGAVNIITFRFINFDAIVPTLPRIRVKFPNLSVRSPVTWKTV